MSIYVGNLPYEIGEEDLREVFAEYGTVSRVQLAIDRETGRSRGCAFVEMESQEQETAAIEALHRTELMGRQLEVRKARPKEEKSGGWGGRGRYS
jgi:RNA recognition motif-containing protein